jgi:hypothetical protein
LGAGIVRVMAGDVKETCYAAHIGFGIWVYFWRWSAAFGYHAGAWEPECVGAMGLRGNGYFFFCILIAQSWGNQQKFPFSLRS